MGVVVIEEAGLWLPADVDGNPSYSARQDRFLIESIFSEGVVDVLTGQLTVSQRALGANWTVDVAAGAAVVTGDDQTRQGRYLQRVPASINVAVPAKPGAGLTRYDRVVLRVYDSAMQGGVTESRTEVEVVAGTEVSSGTASPPATPDTAISLATVGPLTNATASITNDLITDTRLNAGSTLAQVYDPVDANVLPSAYPYGIHYGVIAASPTGGWPGGTSSGASGTVLTIKRQNSRVIQYFYEADADLTRHGVFQRMGYIGSGGEDGWSGWHELNAGARSDQTTVSAEESTTSTSFVGSNGPSVSSIRVPPSGKVLVHVSARLRNSDAAGRTIMSFDSTGSATVAASDERGIAHTGTGSDRFSASVLLTGLTAGTTTFVSRYRVTAGTGFFANRQLAVQPL